MLQRLKIRNLGPTESLEAEFGSRLNLVTGDNGLGKSFLLDVAYWSLTGTWADQRVAFPHRPVTPANVEYDRGNVTGKRLISGNYRFDPPTQRFKRVPNGEEWHKQHGDGPGLVLYATSDMGVSVAHTVGPSPEPVGERLKVFQRHFDFHAENIAYGLLESVNGNGHSTIVSRGLIGDWAQWAEARSESDSAEQFRRLQAVVNVLLDEQDCIEVAGAKRVFLDDKRQYPLLRMRYGETAWPHWSASMRRIVGLAYMLVWAWADHVERSALAEQPPTDSIVLLIDEVEAHLHPTWQRRILPALLKAVQVLAGEVHVQLIVTTHSPLVLASAEPMFDREKDRLFLFEQDKETGKVTFEDLEWVSNGDTDAWLTSPVFGLGRPRSLRGEKALIAAENFLLGRVDKLEDGLRTRDEIDQELRRVLPAHDWFWPRWKLQPTP